VSPPDEFPSLFPLFSLVPVPPHFPVTPLATVFFKEGFGQRPPLGIPLHCRLRLPDQVLRPLFSRASGATVPLSFSVALLLIHIPINSTSPLQPRGPFFCVDLPTLPGRFPPRHVVSSCLAIPIERSLCNSFSPPKVSAPSTSPCLKAFSLFVLPVAFLFFSYALSCRLLLHSPLMLSLARSPFSCFCPAPFSPSNSSRRLTILAVFILTLPS